MRSADGKIFEVDNPVVTPPEADTFRSATKEELQQRRDEFLLAAEAAPASGAELELLARRGQDLVAELKDDAQLARRVARIYLDLGAQQQRLGQTSNAIASFAYAIKLDPKMPIIMSGAPISMHWPVSPKLHWQISRRPLR